MQNLIATGPNQPRTIPFQPDNKLLFLYFHVAQRKLCTISPSANPNLGKALSESIGGRVSTLHTGRSSFDLNSRLVHGERERGQRERRSKFGRGTAYKASGRKRSERKGVARRAGQEITSPDVRSFGFRAPCTTQDSGGAPSQGRGKETRRRKRERKERRGEERRKRRPERRRERKR